MGYAPLSLSLALLAVQIQRENILFSILPFLRQPASQSEVASNKPAFAQLQPVRLYLMRYHEVRGWEGGNKGRGCV